LGCTFTDLRRAGASTAHEASSGKALPGATRTRTMSSVSAVMRIRAAPAWTSMPSGRVLKLTTLSREMMGGDGVMGCATPAASVCACAAVVATTRMSKEQSSECTSDRSWHRAPDEYMTVLSTETLA